MGGTIRARFRRGVLEPIDTTINLPEGKEVTITILDLTPAADTDAFLRSPGAWKGLVDGEALIRSIHESRRISTRPEPRL